jgi:hypothetical protein
MVSVNKLAACAIVVFAAVPAHAAAPAAKEAGTGKMFCCEHGRICGDAFPERCRGKAYSILDDKGNLIREEPAPLTPQQKAEAAAEAQRKKDLEEQAREQRRQDQALLQTYTSAQDIDRSQARAELDVGAAIKGAEEKIAAARKQRKKFEDEAEFYKRKSLPPEVAKGLRDSDHEIKTWQELLDVKRKDLASIQAKYDADRKRYAELTGQSAVAVAPVKPTPAAAQPR